MIDIKDVMQVYSGRNGRCCCGCSGKHTYASEYRKMASKHRGYPVTDDEVSDRTVKLIVGKLNKLIAQGRSDYTRPDFVSAVSDTGRLYIAYFVQKTS